MKLYTEYGWFSAPRHGIEKCAAKSTLYQQHSLAKANAVRYRDLAKHSTVHRLETTQVGFHVFTGLSPMVHRFVAYEAPASTPIRPGNRHTRQL